MNTLFHEEIRAHGAGLLRKAVGHHVGMDVWLEALDNPMPSMSALGRFLYAGAIERRRQRALEPKVEEVESMVSVPAVVDKPSIWARLRTILWTALRLRTA